MKSADFNQLLESRLAATRFVLATKADEYATDGDRLHNFKAAAAMLRCTPQQALLGMLAKHLVSIIDLVAMDASVGRPTWDEKIGDAINYLILLEALTHESKP